MKDNYFQVECSKNKNKLLFHSGQLQFSSRYSTKKMNNQSRHHQQTTIKGLFLMSTLKQSIFILMFDVFASPYFFQKALQILSSIPYIIITKIRRMQGVQPKFKLKLIKDEKPICVQDYQLKSILNRSIGVLIMKYSQLTIRNNEKVRIDKQYSGTGILISRDFVLTAAHNVFRRAQNIKPKTIRFILNYEDEKNKKQNLIPIFRCLQSYKKCSDFERQAYDYALLKLQTPIILDNYPSLMTSCQKCLLETNRYISLSVYGYPSQQNKVEFKISCNDKSYTHKDFRQFGLVKSNQKIFKILDKCVMFFIMTTLQGMSGGPISINNDVIGIIHGSTNVNEQPFSKGRLVTNSMIKQLQQWATELEGKKFSVKYWPQCSCCFLNFPLSPEEIANQIKDFNEELTNRKQNQDNTLKKQSLNLKQIDVRMNIMLKFLYLSNNKLVYIDLEHNLLLIKLFIINNQLESIDLSKNIHLTDVFLSKNKLKAINIKTNIELAHLELDQNNLEKIDLSQNKKLAKLSLRENRIKTINIQNNPLLIQLYLNQNPIKDFDLTNNNLINLSIQGTIYLKTVETWNNSNLTYLEIRLTRNLSIIDVSHSQDLKILTLIGNNLSDISLKTNRYLDKLIIAHSQTKSISLRNNINLTWLDLRYNRLNQISLENNSNLTYLNLQSNNLRNIDLSMLTKLVRLELSNNQLQQINTSKCINLVELDVGYNQLKKIDLSLNVKLTTIALYKNQFKSLDLSKNPLVSHLNINRNSLNSITLWYNPEILKRTFYQSFRGNLFCQVILLHKSGERQKCTQWADKLIYQFKKWSPYEKCQLKYKMIENT